ncbi:GNAT family N-acetyltransferase [Candidatus Uhrbacteria bacterium]|nr:GNAT family N-acetyltransferase [Candidatus Uhrbacteria bacterium]
MINPILVDDITAAKEMVDEWRHEVITRGVADPDIRWPFGAKLDGRIMPFFLGLYDSTKLVGILAYEMVYSNSNMPRYSRITAVRELFIYVLPSYRGRGASRIFWEMLYEIAQKNGCRMESMNNVDPHLNEVFGDRVQQHTISVVW